MGFADAIKGVIKWFIPFGIMEYRKRKRMEQDYESRIAKERKRIAKEHKIRKYFQGLPRKNIDSELLEIAEYLDGNPFAVFPYHFTKKYDPREIDVYFDRTSKLDEPYTRRGVIRAKKSTTPP